MCFDTYQKMVLFILNNSSPCYFLFFVFSFIRQLYTCQLFDVHVHLCKFCMVVAS